MVFLIIILLLGLVGYYVYTQVQTKPISNVSVQPTVSPVVSPSVLPTVPSTPEQVVEVIKDTPVIEIQTQQNTIIESLNQQEDLNNITEDLTWQERDQNQIIEGATFVEDTTTAYTEILSPEEQQQNIEITNLLSSGNY